MLLTELLNRRAYIKIQIEELRTYLRTEKDISNFNKIINRLFELEDRFQKYTLILDKVNTQNEVEVGSNTISVATAIRLRQATERKILALTSLICNTRIKLDILDLMRQRDELIEEYHIYDKVISLNDWRTNVD